MQRKLKNILSILLVLLVFLGGMPVEVFSVLASEELYEDETAISEYDEILTGTEILDETVIEEIVSESSLTEDCSIEMTSTQTVSSEEYKTEEFQIEEMTKEIISFLDEDDDVETELESIFYIDLETNETQETIEDIESDIAQQDIKKFERTISHTQEIEHKKLQCNLPTLSDNMAKQFLAFIYNVSDYEALNDVSADEYYHLLIGDYDNINSIEELTAQVWAFSTFVRTSMNKQVADSSYKVEYLSDELCEYLQSELDGMSEIDEEIISEYSDKVDKIFKNAIENILVGVIAEKAGIFVTEEVFQNLQLVISASDKLQSLPSDVEKYVNRVVAVIEGALYIWNNEIKGRAMYFNSYLNNRENYNSADDEAFLFIMEYNKFAIMDSTYASSIIDFFAWITGKDNWDAHTAELDSWAEYLFELEHYIGNIQYDNDDGTGDKNDEDIDSILGSQDVTLTKDVTINRDLFIKSGTLYLNGFTLTVKGDCYQAGGVIDVGGGRLNVEGDYRLQSRKVNAESGEIYYSYSTARIIMEEEKDYIYVGKNFVIDTNNSESNIFNAGILEIKGDFTQESKAPKTHVQGGGDWYYDVYSYRAKGSNKVVLSGNGKQIVSFEDPNESYFADLELQNTDVEFATKISGWILQRDTEFGNGLPNGMLGKFDLNGKALTVNGELDQTKGVLDVNGGKLLVTGDMKAKGELELNSGVVVIEGGLVQSDGNLYVRGGTLDIKGDYRVQNQLVNTESGETYYSYSTARIIMEEEKDYICVGGNFVIDTNNSKSNIFNVGILEIKGNFTQESRAPKTHVQGVGDRYYDESSFRAKGSNKVVLSGNGKQVVSFEDPNESYFADLELQNTDVEFATKISGWILQRDTEFGNGLPNGMLGTFDLNGNTLTVNGKLNQTNGTININQGLLNVSNEYLVNSNGILMMLNELDRVKVDGDFIMQSLISHNGKLIDGKMYIKGNFNQINGNSSNFEASIKHTVILDGTSVQHVTFESRVSAFNNLILTRDKDSYYKFSPDRCWKNITIEQKYRVNFKLYGNLLDEYVSYIDIQRGSTIDEPTSPIQEGYKFTGWYKDVKCTILWDFATDVVEGNMTLYAGWEKEISETESEPETGSQTESESESQTESETESQTETESESQTEPAKKVYTVLFELQGHGIALDEYSKYTEILEGDTIDEPTAPKTKGYKFTGWYKDAACTKPWVFDKDTVKSNIILYAGWRAVDDNPSNKENYSVTFDMRSHGLAPEPYKNILSGSTINPPTAPKAEGYTFTGWYKDANCTTLWSFVTDTVTSDITLYAGWKSVSDDPDIPNEPNNPDTPDKPDIPDNPDTPDEPDIPANPDNPSIGDVLPSDIPADGRIPDGLWTAAMKEYTYNGKPIKPDIHIYYGKTRLKEGWDYTVSYKNNTKAAAAADTKAPKITVKCKNGYTGTVSANFTIKRHTLTESNLIYTPTCQSGKTYTPVLVANGNLLKAKTDYTITYKKDGGTVKSPKKEGNYEIYIQGKNSCEGSFTVPYTVLDGKTTSIVKAKIKIGQMKYGDKPPKAVLTISGQTLIENTDYTVTYANTNAKGTATVICKGIGKYSGVIKKTFKVTAAKLPSNCITVNGDTTLKKGGAKPQVTVSVNGVKLIAGTDYTVTYKNNKKAGKTAIVTVKGKGNYSGSAKKTFVVENSKIQTKSD